MCSSSGQETRATQSESLRSYLPPANLREDNIVLALRICTRVIWLKKNQNLAVVSHQLIETWEDHYSSKLSKLQVPWVPKTSNAIRTVLKLTHRDKHVYQRGFKSTTYMTSFDHRRHALLTHTSSRNHWSTLASISQPSSVSSKLRYIRRMRNNLRCSPAMKSQCKIGYLSPVKAVLYCSAKVMVLFGFSEESARSQWQLWPLSTSHTTWAMQDIVSSSCQPKLASKTLRELLAWALAPTEASSIICLEVWAITRTSRCVCALPKS